MLTKCFLLKSKQASVWHSELLAVTVNISKDLVYGYTSVMVLLRIGHLIKIFISFSSFLPWTRSSTVQLFVDMSKAFDSVVYDLLLGWLSDIGLSNRNWVVHVQNSILSFVLFSIFINNIGNTMLAVTLHLNVNKTVVG